jgi:hypothetical protein
MEWQGTENELAALRKGWRRWTAIVELFARRRRARQRVDPQAYYMLRHEVLDACQVLADMATEKRRRAFYQALASLVQPWLTPHTLIQADREILFDLLSRCRRAERELNGRAWAMAVRKWALPGVAFLVVVAVAFLVVWNAAWLLVPLLEGVHGWSLTLWLAFRQLSALQWVFVGGLAVIAGLLAFCHAMLGRIRVF